MNNNTTAIAAQKALEYCNKNKGWKRICDIKDSSIYDETFEEIAESDRKYWTEFCTSKAEESWREFQGPKCKVPIKVIGANGKCYKDIIEAMKDDNQQIMTVLKIYD